MRRRFYWALVTLLILRAPVLWAAEGAGVRVAVVKARSLAPYKEASEGIKEGLNAGYPAVAVDSYDLEGKLDKGPEIGDLIVKSGAKIVFAVGTEAVQALQGRVGETPLILAMVYDPLEEKLLISSESPHVYGAYLRVPFERRFAVLKKVLPLFSSYALLHKKGEKEGIVKEAKEAAASTGTRLAEIELGTMDELPQALQKASRDSQALLMILDQDLYNKTTVKELLIFSVKNKFPVIALSSNYVQAGALISVSPSFKENGITAGDLGARLLRGEEVSQHFVPTERVGISWNSRIAKLFGISLSPWDGPVDEIY